MSNADVRIRPARPDDAEWIIPLGHRMHEFGPPPWRDVRVMDDAVATQWARELASPTAGSAFLVAEDALGSPVGFMASCALTLVATLFLPETHRIALDAVAAKSVA